MPLTLYASLLALAMVGSCAASASAASIVINGDFQTGTFAGWSVNTSPDTNHPWTIANNGPNFFASTGCVGPECIQGNSTQEAWLSQVLPTVIGETYTLSFDYSPVGGPYDELVVDFGSNQVADIINVADSIVTYTYTVTALTNATQLQFLGRQDPSYNYLDNVSVTTNAAATPEPATFILVGSSMLGLAGAVKRRFV
jgi:hypothetical protein